MAAILTAFTTWATSFATDALSVIEDNFPLLVVVFGAFIALSIFLRVVKRLTGGR